MDSVICNFKHDSSNQLSFLLFVFALEEITGGVRSEDSSLDEHRVEEDQHCRLLTEKGEVFESEDTIVLEDVPIVTPNKDVVATGLSFQVRSHE